MSNKTTETAPERIWLQIDPEAYTDDDDNTAGADEPFPYGEDVSWCSERIGGLEVEYVRADLLEAQERAVPVVTRESAINAIEHVGRYNGPGRETEARQMLVEGSPSVAHHAQAQPPAARVTVDAVMRVIDGQRRLPYCSIDEKQAFRNELEAAIDTQENPNG